MNLTRRVFLTSLAICVLSTCASGCSTTPASDKWHTVVIEGLQISVPSDAELDKELTESLTTIDATTYWIKGNDIIVEVDVLGDDNITGNYEIRNVNGMTTYLAELADGVTEVLIPHDGKLYGIILYFKKDTGTKAAYETDCDHLIESLQF